MKIILHLCKHCLTFMKLQNDTETITQQIRENTFEQKAVPHSENKKSEYISGTQHRSFSQKEPEIQDISLLQWLIQYLYMSFLATTAHV